MAALMLQLAVGAILLTLSPACFAATVEITAEYQPSMTDPNKNTFTNTTPASGYCTTWPTYCPTGGAVSIALPITTQITHPIVANDAVRNNPYFGLPNKPRSLLLLNEHGSSTVLTFRVSIFNAEYSRNVGQYDWGGGSFMYPKGPCSAKAGSVGTAAFLNFIWNVGTGDGACYKVSSIDRSQPERFYKMSIGYEITTKSPLEIDAGTYKGSLRFSVGPGGDFDFGDNYQASEKEIVFNFTLRVTHELRVTPNDGAQKVTLQPCLQGRVCSEQEGRNNWERWMVTRITPNLTGQSRFDISSSGRFSVYLECEQQYDSDCALKSDNRPAQMVPVRTLLTLPVNIVDLATDVSVSKRRLTVNDGPTMNIFKTKSFGTVKTGNIDFLVMQKDVDTMLKDRPDTYRGAITVIFDPRIN